MFVEQVLIILAWETETADILRRHHCFPREMMSEKRAQKFHTDDASLPIWVVLLIGWIKFSTQYDQSEALTRSG